MRYRLRTLITVTAASALLLGGAVPGQATPTPTAHAGGVESTQPAKYDGGDLFRGLLLGHGPVADQYPELAASEVHPDQQAAGDLIVAAVNEASPAFFAGFAADVTSGDRVRTERALTEADTLLTEIMSGLVDAPASSGTDSTWIVTQVSVNVVSPPYTYQSVVLPYYVYMPGMAFDSQLDRERWINAIAEALG